MGSGFSKAKKQAKMMQQQFSMMREQMEKAEAVGSAGNGLVTITLTGEYEIKSIAIKPDCVDPEDVDGLQDLIKAAYADAKKKLSAQTSPNAMKMPGGMPDLSAFGL